MTVPVGFYCAVCRMQTAAAHHHPREVWSVGEEGPEVVVSQTWESPGMAIEIRVLVGDRDDVAEERWGGDYAAYLGARLAELSARVKAAVMAPP